MKWKFWEKDDPLDLPLGDLSADFSAPTSPTPGMTPGMDGLNNPGFSSPSPQPGMDFGTPEHHPPNVTFTPAEPTGTSSNDKSLHFELILARLDSIKTQLDSMNQRLATLEQELSEPKPTSYRGRRAKGPWYTNQ